jgi:hypothetical protein
MTSPLDGVLLEEVLQVQDVRNRIELHREFNRRIRAADFRTFMRTMVPQLLARIYERISWIDPNSGNVRRNLDAELGQEQDIPFTGDGAMGLRDLIANLATTPLSHRHRFVREILNTIRFELNDFIRVIGTPRTQQHIINTNASIILHFLDTMIEESESL